MAKRRAPLRLLLTTDAVGGVWQYTLDLARCLCRDGLDVTVATLGPQPGPRELATARAIPGVHLVLTEQPLDWTAETPAQLAAAARDVARIAAAHGADVVQVHAPALAAAAYDMPVVAVIHSCVATWWHTVRGGPLPVDLRWRADAAKAGLQRAATVVAPSLSFAQLLTTTYRLPRLPLVVRNGRSMPPIAPNSAGDYAITAGRLWDEGKNAATLDRAAALAALPVHAAGPVRGPHGVEISLDHLTLLGQLGEADARRRIAGATAFVSAARYEPFGLAVLEAAQAGVPLVLSDIPTFRELWRGAAAFVAVDDAAGFAAVLDHLATDKARRRRLGAAARRRARRYTGERMAQSYAALYQRLVRVAGQGQEVAVG